jgi:hypothetical protein
MHVHLCSGCRFPQWLHRLHWRRLFGYRQLSDEDRQGSDEPGVPLGTLPLSSSSSSQRVLSRDSIGERKKTEDVRPNSPRPMPLGEGEGELGGPGAA